MRRSTLVTAAVLGGLVCVIGGTGLFAALQDSARSGTNTVDSAALAASADIQVATAAHSGSTVACGTFSEDLTTAFFSVTGATPGTGTDGGNEKLYCIRNVGSEEVTLSALSDALSDVDLACTGDEELHGDTTCQASPPAAAPGVGELSSVLHVVYVQLDCATGGGVASSALLSDNAVTPHSLGTVAAGATRCFGTSVRYRQDHESAAVQQAQSDRVTWRHRWVAQA